MLVTLIYGHLCFCCIFIFCFSHFLTMSMYYVRSCCCRSGEWCEYILPAWRDWSHNNHLKVAISTAIQTISNKPNCQSRHTVSLNLSDWLDLISCSSDLTGLAKNLSEQSLILFQSNNTDLTNEGTCKIWRNFLKNSVFFDATNIYYALWCANKLATINACCHLSF